METTMLLQCRLSRFIAYQECNLECLLLRLVANVVGFRTVGHTVVLMSWLNRGKESEAANGGFNGTIGEAESRVSKSSKQNKATPSYAILILFRQSCLPQVCVHPSLSSSLWNPSIDLSSLNTSGGWDPGLGICALPYLSLLQRSITPTILYYLTTHSILSSVCPPSACGKPEKANRQFDDCKDVKRKEVYARTQSRADLENCGIDLGHDISYLLAGAASLVVCVSIFAWLAR